MYPVGNSESWDFSYVQTFKSVGKDIKDYQKGDTNTNHQFLNIRFENDRLVILIETKNSFNKWDHNKIRKQL